MTKFRHFAGAILISTTAIGSGTPLPFITSDGELKVAEARRAAHIKSGVLTMQVKDSGLASPVPTDDCPQCIRQARLFYSGSFTPWLGGLRPSRVAYVKRAPGSAAGGMVFQLDVTRAGWKKIPQRISAITDACGIVPTDTADPKKVDNSVLVLVRAGPDHDCDAPADNLATVIRLNSPETDAGTTLPLLLDTGNPLQAQANAGRLTGFLSFESGAGGPVLVHRDLQLGNPAVLLEMDQTTAANLVRTDAGRLFVTAAPAGTGLTLFRVEPSGSLSAPLYTFTGFNAGNPLEGGLRDATYLYLSDQNRLLRVPLKATVESAEVITTLDPALHINRRLLDTSTRPARIVFDAEDDAFSTLGGVFSAPVSGNNVEATVLQHTPDSEGGTANIEVVAHGRAFINIIKHFATHDALVVKTDGTEPTYVVHAYWAGSTRTTTRSASPAYIFYATRVLADEGGDVGTDTLMALNPRTLAIRAVLGSVSNAQRYKAITVSGVGRSALARARIDRFGAIDNDLYSLDARTPGSLTLVADTPADDLPIAR